MRFRRSTGRRFGDPPTALSRIVDPAVDRVRQILQRFLARGAVGYAAGEGRRICDEPAAEPAVQKLNEDFVAAYQFFPSITASSRSTNSIT